MPIQQEVIDEVKQRLVKVYDPLSIYLFGSYAWGHPNEESDLDLLVVVEESSEKRHRRGKPGYEALWGMEVFKDLVVYTKQEVEMRAGDPHSLVHKILKDGKLLYVRS